MGNFVNFGVLVGYGNGMEQNAGVAVFRIRAN